MEALMMKLMYVANKNPIHILKYLNILPHSTLPYLFYTSRKITLTTKLYLPHQFLLNLNKIKVVYKTQPVLHVIHYLCYVSKAGILDNLVAINTTHLHYNPPFFLLNRKYKKNNDINDENQEYETPSFCEVELVRRTEQTR